MRQTLILVILRKKKVFPRISIVLWRTWKLRNAIKMLVSKTERCPWHSRLAISHSQLTWLVGGWVWNRGAVSVLGKMMREARNCHSTAKQFQFIQAQLTNLISDHDQRQKKKKWRSDERCKVRIMNENYAINYSSVSMEENCQRVWHIICRKIGVIKTEVEFNNYLAIYRTKLVYISFLFVIKLQENVEDKLKDTFILYIWLSFKFKSMA